MASESQNMNGFLSNKIAAVTGATKGIGYAIAESLAREGAAVAICGRSKQTAEAAAHKLSERTGSKVVGLGVDVRDQNRVSEFFRLIDETFGGLDILVNNAGLGIFAPVAELTFDAWRETLETNLSGVFYCCKEAIPRLRRRGGGSVINISSLAGKNPFAGGSA